MASPKQPLCLHCKARRANRPRGLCWTCYYTPGVLLHFPSASKYARRGVLDREGPVPRPSTRTTARPGTLRKIAALRSRASAGVSLWHAADQTFELPEPAWQEWQRDEEEEQDECV